jgi:hypothetical protein
VATDDDPAAMVNPGMQHTTAALDAAAADGADNSRSSGPLGGVKAEEKLAPETFKFEHVAPTAELVLNETKRTPVTETILKAMTAGIWNAIVKVTLWLRLSVAWYLDKAMLAPVPAIWKMGPENTGIEGHLMLQTTTIAAFPPWVALPIIKPLMVTVNAVPALILAPDTESTNDVLVVSSQVKLSAETLLAFEATKGTTDGKKKFEGYVNIIDPEELIILSGTKDRVKLAFDFWAIRSVKEIMNKAAGLLQ